MSELVINAAKVENGELAIIITIDGHSCPFKAKIKQLTTFRPPERRDLALAGELVLDLELPNEVIRNLSYDQIKRLG